MTVLDCLRRLTGVAFLTFTLSLSAQSIQYGKITGTITDADGSPLPGVTMTAASNALVSGHRTAVTRDNGKFVFLNLPSGMYKVTATLTGFATAVKEKVSV